MVVVSISETYDLSTVKDKMTLIGVHTPTKELIQKTYPGLCMNSRYFRIVKTDVVLSCVSSAVAITPDMVGDNSVDGIAPEDMLNPILYKAVSNDSWSTLEARLQGLNFQATGNAAGIVPPLSGSMAFAEQDNVTGLTDEFGVYYSLLSNRDGFRVAPIQAGMSMRGLKPLVFDKWYSHGENVSAGAGQEMGRAITEPTSSPDTLQLQNYPASGFRGRPHAMPRINTTYLTGIGGTGSATPGTHSQYNGMGNGQPANFQIEMPPIPPVMLACIVMPPCRKTKLFFRMVCRTWISFEEVRPIQEITAFADMNTVYSGVVYHSDYNEQSSKMDVTTDMVDIKNGDIEKIMEGR